MTILNVEDFLECVDHRVNDNEVFQWTCYGDNALIMSHWNGQHCDKEINITIVYDSVDRTVYEMEAWDGPNDRQYRWIHPDYVEAVKAECQERNINFETSIDNKKFIDVEVVEDILEKASAIYRGEDYDTRIIVQIDLTHDEQFELMRLAHEADITVNEYIKRILEKVIGDDHDNKANQSL